MFGANSVAEQGLFQSGWFVVGVLTQTLVVHMIRTPEVLFVESRAAVPLTVTMLVIAAVGIFLPTSPLADYFKLQRSPPDYFPLLIGLLLGYGAPICNTAVISMPNTNGNVGAKETYAKIPSRSVSWPA